MPRRRTLEGIKEELKSISPSIEILSTEYVNSKTKLRCRCKICGHEWLVDWNHLQKGRGCPPCSGKVKLTLEGIRLKLSFMNPNIEIVSKEYVNSSSLIKCRCLIDGHEWYTTWSHLQQGQGCPKCAGNIKLTLEEIKEKLFRISPTIKITSPEYLNNKSGLDCLCEVCGHRWVSNWKNLSKGHGCPNCANSIKLTIEYIKHRMSEINPNIRITSNTYVNAFTHLECECLTCGHTWEATWANLSFGYGCPSCANERKGWTRSKWLNQAESSSNFDGFKLYIIKCKDGNEKFFKIGITFMKLASRYQKNHIPYDYEVIKIIESEDGEYIWNLEKKLHKMHRDANLRYSPEIPFKGSKTECFSELLLEEVNALA